MPIMQVAVRQSRRRAMCWPEVSNLGLQFVREWAVLRHDEILANWERARRNEPLLGIDPLA